MANTKISALTSLDKTTVAPADVLPVVDTSAGTAKNIRYDELIQPQDTHFRISGGSDQTKKVQFEVDGLTTGTTRVITIPDASTTMVGTDTVQTISGKTFTSPKINLGTDATGDMYYRDGSGNLARLPIGSAGQILDVSDTGLPEWIANPSAANASTTVKGVVEIATSSEINAGTATGGTGAALVVTPDQLAGSAPTFSGANLTGVLKADYSQKMVGLSTTSFPNANVTITSNTAGTEICYCHPTASGSTTWAIGRLAQDSTTGQWYTVETTTFTAGTSNTNGNQCGLAYLGSFVYMSVYDGGAPNRYLYRFSNTNLTAGATAMTLSGTGGNAGAQSMFSNGSDLVIYGGGTNWYRYTVSGTTYTNAQTLTGPASAISTVFDGTNVYSYDGATLSKYAPTLGAASATATLRYGAYFGTNVRVGAGIHFINSSAINVINSGLSTQNLLFLTPLSKI